VAGEHGVRESGVCDAQSLLKLERLCRRERSRRFKPRAMVELGCPGHVIASEQREVHSFPHRNELLERVGVGATGIAPGGVSVLHIVLGAPEAEAIRGGENGNERPLCGDGSVVLLDGGGGEAPLGGAGVVSGGGDGETEPAEEFVHLADDGMKARLEGGNLGSGRRPKGDESRSGRCGGRGGDTGCGRHHDRSTAARAPATGTAL